MGEQMTIIALSGKKQVGKDTFSSVLCKRYNFQSIALADPIRNICARVFYLSPDMFSNEKKDARMQRINIDFHDVDAIRHIVESEWNYTISEESRNIMETLHGVGIDSPRDALRIVGNMLRDAISPNIWIELAAAKMKELGGRVIITDCRFENEREFFRKIGAVSVLIKRNDNGNPVEHEFNLGLDDEYDVIFTNDGELHTYKSEIDMWYNVRQNDFTLYKVWKYE